MPIFSKTSALAEATLILWISQNLPYCLLAIWEHLSEFRVFCCVTHRKKPLGGDISILSLSWVCSISKWHALTLSGAYSSICMLLETMSIALCTLLHWIILGKLLWISDISQYIFWFLFFFIYKVENSTRYLSKFLQEFILIFLNVIYSQMTPFHEWSYLLELEPLSSQLCLIQ
jgi:hypothetical protein